MATTSRSDVMAAMLVKLAAVLLLGCLGSPAESGNGRPQPLEATRAVVVPAAANLTSSLLDESKIKIVWCLSGQCDYFGRGMQDCYCCGDPYQKDNCHVTMEDCKSACPACNPECPA